MAQKKTLRQIEIATNTDDATIAEMLAEDADPNYKLPYSEAFIVKNNLRRPSEIKREELSSGDFSILTWNCGGAFRKKYNAILNLEASVYVIQECENPNTSTDESYKSWGANCLWIGENKHKGLGVFPAPGVVIEDLLWDANGLKYFIACRVNNKFNLVATWCHGANSPTFGYIGQLWKYLQIHKTKLSNAIIAGDFNSNVIWDKWDRWWNHSDVLRELAELGIESLYHKFYNEEQGKEVRPTFYLRKNRTKPYHIDYIFGSADFADSIETFAIGHPEQWLELSDHMPVILTVGGSNIF